MNLFQPFTRAHGVDISDKMMRIVDAQRKDGEIIVNGFAEIPIENGIISEGKIKNPVKAVDAFKRLYDSVNGSIASPFAIVAVPERKTFTKIATIEKLPEDELADAIQFEAEQHFPVSLDDMYIAWSLIETLDDKQIILLSATDKTIIDQYITLFAKNNKYMTIAEPETFAVKRALLPRATKPTLIIDLGKSKTTLSIVSGNTIKYTTTIQFSGNTLTSSIAKELNLSEEQAERAKVLFGMNPQKSKGAVQKLLKPLFDPFFDQVSDIIRYYTNTFESNEKISHVMLCGGGSQMEGVTEFLTEKLDLQVEMQSLKLNTKHKNTLLFSKSAPLSYTTGLGLSFRNEDQKPFEMIFSK